MFDDFEPDPKHYEYRNNKTHMTKRGKFIGIKDMTDDHLYNSAKMFGIEKYSDEIILRMFLKYIKDKN